MANNAIDLENNPNLTEADVDALIAAHEQKRAQKDQKSQKSDRAVFIKDEKLLKVVKWATLAILVVATLYLAVMMIIGINFMNQESSEADSNYSSAQGVSY